MGVPQTKLRLGKSLLLAAACIGYPALAETTIEPYVEARQVISLNDFSLDNFRTWGEAAAGLAANVDTRRVDGALRYRISHRFPIDGPVTDRTRHTGSASLNSVILRDYLYLSAAGNASVVDTSLAGLFDPDSDSPGQQQIFGGSIRPSFVHTFMNRIRAAASYSYAALEAEGGPEPLIIGRPVNLERFLSGVSDTRSHSASASIGNVGRSDRLRVRLLGNYQRDRIEQLDEHYRYLRGIADVELALGRVISLVGSGGYEEVSDVQDSVLFDPVTGLPVLSAQGLLQVDPREPRRTIFEFEGPTWDAGVRLSPSRRTDLLVRAGERYGSFSGTVSLNYRVRPDLIFSAGYNDSINNFGRLFTAFYIDPVTGFGTPLLSYSGGGRRTPIGGGSCFYGYDPDTQTCLFNISQIASSAVFRNRVANLTLTKGSEEFDNGQRFYGTASLFYNHRRYLGEADTGAQVGFNPALTLAGTSDESFGLAAQGQRLLSRRSYAVFDLRAQRNTYGLSRGTQDVFVSARGRYEMLLDRNINVFANAFIGRRFASGGNEGSPLPNRFRGDDTTRVTFSIGVRYLFAPYRGAFTPAEHQASRPY